MRRSVVYVLSIILLTASASAQAGLWLEPYALGGSPQAGPWIEPAGLEAPQAGPWLDPDG